MPDYFDTGFCVRKASWHGKETLLQEFPESWDEARLAAGLMWEPTYLDVYVPRWVKPGESVPEGSTFIREDAVQQLWHVPCLDHRAIARDDTWAVLATAPKSFRLIFHHQMGELLESYSEAWRKAGATVLYDTAGSVEGGAKVYATLLLDEPYHISGDPSPILPYAALLNAHDGTGACRVVATQVRVVCANTWKMAEYDSASRGTQITIRHSSGADAKVEEAKAVLAQVRDEAESFRMLAEELASINVSDGLVQTFLHDFIPVPENASERTRNDRLERQATFMALYEGSPTTDGIRGTAYGLLQTAGEYLDHIRPYRSQETYLKRTLINAEPIKGNALRSIQQLVKEGV